MWARMTLEGGDKYCSMAHGLAIYESVRYHFHGSRHERQELSCDKELILGSRTRIVQYLFAYI